MHEPKLCCLMIVTRAGVTLTLVVVGGPRQQVVRPKDLEADELEEAITREALFGSYRILDRKFGNGVRDSR